MIFQGFQIKELDDCQGVVFFEQEFPETLYYASSKMEAKKIIAHMLKDRPF